MLTYYINITATSLLFMGAQRLVTAGQILGQICRRQVFEGTADCKETNV